MTNTPTSGRGKGEAPDTALPKTTLRRPDAAPSDKQQAAASKRKPAVTTANGNDADEDLFNDLPV
ncbi:hypothetical protein [Roseicyclus sp.]|uniref:hypothetical protein n=1 Tax=Roseicyclus sp. TaxID=1914329 RepID=UPI003F6C5216